MMMMMMIIIIIIIIPVIIPVIIRPVGTTSISFRKYLKIIPVVHIKEIHTTAILLIWKILM